MAAFEGTAGNPGGNMSSRLAKLAIAAALLVAACGGGDSDTTTTDASPSGTDQPSTTVAATTAAPTTTSGTVSGNTDDEFCEFIIAYANEVEAEFNVISLSPEELEAAFNDNLDSINQALALAPDELRDDVALFADAYGGFIDFLSEYDFNFLAIPEDAFDDPRLAALEDPALEEAGNRIEEYCGVENFITPAPTPPTGGGGGPSSVITGGDVPDEFPSELEPPGGVVVASFSGAGALSVTFDSSESAEDVVDFYTDILGPPTAQTPEGALWTMTYEGTFLNIVVAEIEGGTSQINVSLGG